MYNLCAVRFDASGVMCRIEFSDGTPLTADDVIFSMYVYSDMDYDGYATFSGTPIKGLQNYRLNSTVADSITDEDQTIG